MAKLKILTAGDPVLRQTAAEVTKIDKKLIKLLKDMAETMYAADGVGLAAPQIGVSKLPRYGKRSEGICSQPGVRLHL